MSKTLGKSSPSSGAHEHYAGEFASKGRLKKAVQKDSAYHVHHAAKHAEIARTAAEAHASATGSDKAKHALVIAHAVKKAEKHAKEAEAEAPGSAHAASAKASAEEARAHLKSTTGKAVNAAPTSTEEPVKTKSRNAKLIDKIDEIKSNSTKSAPKIEKSEKKISGKSKKKEFEWAPAPAPKPISKTELPKTSETHSDTKLSDADHATTGKRIAESLNSGDFKSAHGHLEEHLSKELYRHSFSGKNATVLDTAKHPMVLGVNGEHGVSVRADQVELAGKFAKNPSSFAAGSPEYQGMSTIVHETLHSYGPVEHLGLKANGTRVEELTTEVAARVMMNKMYGTPVLAHNAKSHETDAYRHEISAATHAIATAMGVTPAKAFEHLQDAAIDFKRQKAAKDHFLAHIEKGGLGSDTSVIALAHSISRVTGHSATEIHANLKSEFAALAERQRLGQ